MDYKNARACVVDLGEGKRESDEEECCLVVRKAIRKNICCSQKLAVMGPDIAVGPMFARNLQNYHW